MADGYIKGSTTDWDTAAIFVDELRTSGNSGKTAAS
jgi:hypothetical protein